MSPLARPPFCVIQEGKQKSRDLAEAVIAGFGGGAIGYCTPAAEIKPDYMPVIIGPHPTTVQTLHDLRSACRPFVTIDNGYFKPYRDGGYFRATTNALQWIAQDPPYVGRKPAAGGRERFEALGLEVKSWRRDDGDGHILLPLQSPVWLRMMHETDDWLSDWLRTLRLHTKREIVVRLKPLKGTPAQPPLEAQLENCHAVIAYSSNVMLKAVMAGIPVLPLAACAVSPLGEHELGNIEHPRKPLRLPVLHDLAANQWTIEEIASGRMWADLADRYEPGFLELA